MPWSSQYQGIVENAPDAILLVDADGRIALVNHQTERLFGYDREELLGMRVEVLIPRRYHDRHHQYRETYSAAPTVRPMAMAGNSELHAVRRDGSEFPVEISLAPLETEKGAFTMAAVRDVTSRVQGEKRFRDLIEAGPDPTVIVNGQGEIELVNEELERVFGFTRDDLLGKPVELLVPERFRGMHVIHRENYVRNPRRRRDTGSTPLFAMRKDGTEFPVEISLAPIETEGRTLVSAVIRDISSRLEIEETADRLRDELIATISHELRTPLTSIIGYAELLGDMEDEHISRPARRLLDIIMRNADRELRLVDDLLTMAFMDDDRMQVNRARVDLIDVMKAALEDVRVLANDRKQTLVVEAADHCFVLGDALRLEQAIENVLDNAVKFSPAEGSITVRVRASGSMAVIEVEDTGMGFSHAEQSKLFDRLYRTPAAAAAQIQGAGLGLAIVKAIIDAHSGWIDVESEPGRGSRFRISLPAEVEFPRTQTASVRSPAR